MILALILFALSYILMLALPQQRPFVALGGNLTPIGASANIAAIGILRKSGETVRTKDFCASASPYAGRRADGLRLPVVGVGVSTRLSQKTT